MDIMNDNSPFVVSAIGLTKRRGDFQLGPFDFQITAGYVTGFIGANGAGKTSTIKLLLGMMRPDAGDISLVPPRELLGVVLDSPFLVPDWRVTDAGVALRAAYPNWDDSRFRELVNSFGLRPQEKVKYLSRGEGTKLMLALALGHRPQVLILDEPTAGLDPAARADLIDILRGFMENPQHTILFSTHITTDLDSFADFIVVIVRGQIVFTGTRDDLLSS